MKQQFKEWTQLMCCPTLSPKEKVVIGNILRISNIGTWNYISHDYLVKVTKMSLSTLKRTLKSLEKRELIVTVVVPKKNSREHFNNYIPQIETITSVINQKVNLDYCSFGGFDCEEDGKSFEINGLDTQEISMGQFEPLIKRNKNKGNNNNNYNNSTSRYMVSLITSGSDFDPLNTTETTSGSKNNPQVGRKTPDIYNINKKNIVKRVKENIKEKRESNEMINGKLNRKDEVKDKQSNNNMDFKKHGMYMELNSQSAVQSKDWTKETKEEKTHSSSAGTTKVIQIGDTRYAVETANTDSSIWDSFPGGTASRENKKVQRVTTTEDRKDNTLSNASLHNENEDNPNATKPTTAGQNINPKTALNNPKTAGATETAHSEVLSMQVDNYPTHTEKTSQEANKWANQGNGTHSPMDCGGMSIDKLEDIYNGGNPTPTQPISKVRSQTTSKAKSNEGGGGRKFTPRKEWDIAMRVVLQHINNSSDMYNKLTTDDVNILYEGASDKYRVIETIKAIQLMLTYRMKFPTYRYLLNDAIDTLEANEEEYTTKQLNYAYEIYDDCVNRYEKITN